jgi:MYXO-CTERM domain-containing protein
MIPGLQTPSERVRAPRFAPRSIGVTSLRPNTTSLRPDTEPEPTPRASGSRVRRWHVAFGCGLAVTAVAVAATWPSRAAHPKNAPEPTVVSGRAGLKTTSSGASERWFPGTATITIDPALAAATPGAKDAIIAAFGAWASSGASLPQLAFDSTSTPGQAVQDGVNRLLLGPITVPGQEADLAITITYADTSTGEIIEADTIFNDAYDWTSVGSDGIACSTGYDLQNVATHEAGHFFGLGEDYDDTTTTMYVSSLPCQTSKRTLTSSDVTVMSGLYAKAPATSAAAGCGARIAPGSSTDGAAWAALGVVALVATRRRRSVRP